MSNILLSICIPTYNRAEYIGEAIESILMQITPAIKDKVEICVSDNASTDNTQEIVKKYQDKNICKIIFYKNEKNLGADRNYLKVIEIANGEYCWWLGSDDALEVNTLSTLIEKINATHYDLYLLTQNCYSCDFNIKYECNNHPLLNRREDSELKLNDILGEAIYLLGYLSVLIVKRDDFIIDMPLDEKYIGSMYVHTYKILYLISKQKKMYHIRQPIVKWRGDNDSFLSDLKIYGRIKIDIDGYSSIAEDVFGRNSKEYKTIVKIRVFNKMVRHILLLKLNSFDRKEILKLYERFKDETFYYNLARFISLVPKELIHFIRFVYRKTIKRY